MRYRIPPGSDSRWYNPATVGSTYGTGSGIWRGFVTRRARPIHLHPKPDPRDVAEQHIRSRGIYLPPVLERA